MTKFNLLIACAYGVTEALIIQVAMRHKGYPIMKETLESELPYLKENELSEALKNLTEKRIIRREVDGTLYNLTDFGKQIIEVAEV